MSFTSPLRRAVGALLLTAAASLPHTADAQAITYSFDGTFGGPGGPTSAAFALTGDAANVQAVDPLTALFTGYANANLTGTVTIQGVTQSFVGYILLNVVDPGTSGFTTPGLYFTTGLGLGDPVFALAAPAFAGYDLRGALGPTAVDASASLDFSAGVVPGGGTFQATGGVVAGPPPNVVPEPATVALLGAGLLALAVGAALGRGRRTPA